MAVVRWVNIVAAALHFASLVAIFVFGFSPETIARTTWALKQDTISVHAQAAEAPQSAGVCDVAPPNTFAFGDTVLGVSTFPSQSTWARLPMFWLVAAFFALSGVFQGAVELSPFFFWMRDGGIYDKMFPSQPEAEGHPYDSSAARPPPGTPLPTAPTLKPSPSNPAFDQTKPTATALRKRHVTFVGLSTGFEKDSGAKRESQCTLYINWLRYIEYSLSATVMLVAISLAAGINDIDVLACMSVMCASCMLLGMVAEYNFRVCVYLRSTEDATLLWIADICAICYKTSHALAWALLAVPWFVVVKRYMQWWGGCSGPGVRPPDFVQAIVVTQAILFAAFGFVQVFQFAFPASRMTAELLYIVLSLVSKTLLGWLIGANVLVATPGA